MYIHSYGSRFGLVLPLPPPPSKNLTIINLQMYVHTYRVDRYVDR